MFIRHTYLDLRNSYEAFLPGIKVKPPNLTKDVSFRFPLCILTSSSFSSHLKFVNTILGTGRSITDMTFGNCHNQP